MTLSLLMGRWGFILVIDGQWKSVWPLEVTRKRFFSSQSVTLRVFWLVQVTFNVPAKVDAERLS